ncbi:hypothetical protein IL38_15200 [Actinopolyspora erythraea]|uniref:PPE family domain-containing protein n=1 Tax=Actinopolyspora erythraea TaxID=414996 RepID=A0ABR4X243_9ACTN|nr:hypothetical protein IL38_15200 [Actinopolyspora erythraea]
MPGTVRDDVGKLFGYDTRAENAQQEQAAAAEEEGEKRRQELEERNRRLDAPAGYDPQSIKQHENWQSYDHKKIYDTNQSTLNFSDAKAVGEAWRDIGKKLAELGERLEGDSTKAIDSGWSGKAAETAKQSAQPLATWARGSGECFRLTGNKIEEAGSAAGQVKEMVPPPRDYNVSRSFFAGVASGPTGAQQDAKRQMQERQQEERKAQETMDRVLSATYRDVDATVPAYRQLDGEPAQPPSQPPVGEPPAVPPAVPPGRTGQGTAPGDYSGSGVGGNGSDGAGSGHGIQPGTGGSYPGQGGAGGGSGTGSGPGTSGQPPGAGDYPDSPAGSGSAWTSDPGGSTTPGSPGASNGPGGSGGAAGRGAGGSAGGVGGVGGYAGGTGGGGTPSGSGRGGTTPGSGGRAGTAPIRGGSTTSGTAATGTTPGRAGGGRAPVGGLGAGRGQGGDEDQEHERPSWLEEWDDVWFNDMPRTAPPVIE